MADHADDDDVFIYMGGEQEVPRHVTHVRVHKSVKIIRMRAFLGCINLVLIEMHDGVEIIEQEAFCYCRCLKRIKLPGVRVIGKLAFWQCRMLDDIKFGNQLDTIGDSAFAACISLRNIKIPNVRIIGAAAFTGCEQLTDVELSKDLERIGRDALSGIRRMRRIGMPLKDNLFQDNNVFRGCDGLSRVDLVGGIDRTISSFLLDCWRSEMKDDIDRINQVLPNILLRRPPRIPVRQLNSSRRMNSATRMEYALSIPSDEPKTVAIQQWVERVKGRIEHFKSEHYALLKDAMSLLELALWKANLDENVGCDDAAREGVRVTRGQRKRARKDRCITSGASIVIKNVLPFLELEP